jgi:hypothetical protein
VGASRHRRRIFGLEADRLPRRASGVAPQTRWHFPEARGIPANPHSQSERSSPEADSEPDGRWVRAAPPVDPRHAAPHPPLLVCRRGSYEPTASASSVRRPRAGVRAALVRRVRQPEIRGSSSSAVVPWGSDCCRWRAACSSGFEWPDFGVRHSVSPWARSPGWLSDLAASSSADRASVSNRASASSHEVTAAAAS